MSKRQPKAMFDGKNPFVDLHLDFPVQRGAYVPGMTPFMMAMQAVSKDLDIEESQLNGDDGIIDPEAIHDKNKNDNDNGTPKPILAMQFHAQRLKTLNELSERHGEIKSIIGLYKGKNKQLFKKKVGDFLGADFGPSTKPQDLNFSLYKFIHTIFSPFLLHDNVIELNNDIMQTVRSLPTEPLKLFIREIIDSGYLKTLQLDCLKLYPEMYEAEMPLRSALFLDIVSQDSPLAAGRISTKDFNSYKDLYKDICEIISRQLILIAGINNIIRRGSHNEFLVVSGGKLSSLSKLSEKTLSERFKYLDDPWYDMDKTVLDAGIRNSIAHNNISYNDRTQLITYFPGGGTITQAKGESIYFLHFMRLIISAFRETHDMHLIIKALFYADYLVFNRDAQATS